VTRQRSLRAVGVGPAIAIAVAVGVAVGVCSVLGIGTAPVSAAVGPSAFSTTPVAAAASGPGWRWPLAGTPVVATPFRPPATRYGAGHRGVDLTADPGTPVLAAGDGVVGFAGMLAGRGVVTVVHGALRTTYEPVEPGVSVGQVVRAGDALGTLAAGHTGCPVATACLHWGLRRGEDYLDPLSLLRRQRSRLLPVWGVPLPGQARALGSPPVASVVLPTAA
jgi:murein DD-endopeptidase MepM/ murein hydrolase activator NlpD